MKNISTARKQARARRSEPPQADAERERRIPAQARSRERVERILDAAALEFAEHGFDATTIEAIALRGGTSVGSIYQFFPNKLALFNALASRYREKVRMLFDGLITAEVLARPWPEVVSDAVDAFGAFHMSEPGFRAVWLSLKLTEELLTAGEALNREFAKRVEMVLAVQAQDLLPKDRAIVATVVVETVTAMLIVAARRPSLAPRILEETKKLVIRYLTPYAPLPTSQRTAKKR